MQDNENKVLRCKCYDGSSDRPENQSERLWADDAVQFPRLLAEIMATQDTLNLKAIADEMDLSVSDVSELIDRAQKKWDSIKAGIIIGTNLAEVHQENEAASKASPDEESGSQLLTIPVISIDHLDDEAASWLEEGCDGVSEVQVLIDGNGYLLKLPLDEESIGGHQCLIDIRDHFAELEGCVREDCVWVRLDANGDVIENLPHY